MWTFYVFPGPPYCRYVVVSLCFPQNVGLLSAERVKTKIPEFLYTNKVVLLFTEATAYSE